MATKKTTLSPETAQAISALDWAVKNLTSDGRVADEFSAADYRARMSLTRPMTTAAARSLLARAVEVGKLSRRAGREDGRRVTFYSLAAVQSAL